MTAEEVDHLVIEILRERDWRPLSDVEIARLAELYLPTPEAAP